MAREKGMGNLQREKSGRWTMRVGIDGKRYCRSTRTKDRDQAERVLQRFLAPFGLGERRLPLADVWLTARGSLLIGGLWQLRRVPKWSMDSGRNYSHNLRERGLR